MVGQKLIKKAVRSPQSFTAVRPSHTFFIDSLVGPALYLYLLKSSVHPPHMQ